MKSKKEYIESLWSNKSTSEVILLLYELLDNSFYTQDEKTKVKSVLRGIIAYTDRGEELYEHHRAYLRNTWDSVWLDQRDQRVKHGILDYLQKK